MTADQVIAQLALEPHPEGGFYRETFRAELVATPRGPRAASTAIYFLLRAGDFSALHSVTSDEIWHHYQGAPVELHVFGADGHRLVQLGSGPEHQHVVRAGELQAARVPSSAGHPYALCGCTVAPGFDFADFAMPSRAELLERLGGEHGEHGEHAELVRSLTRS